MSTDITPRRILHEDPDVLAVDKPSGLPSHATVDPARDHLVAALTRFLQARDGTAGHLVQLHRLDRDTSGVLLFSRDPAHDAALAAAFAERRVHKRYLAIVHDPTGEGLAGGEVTIDAPLSPGKRPGGRTAVVRSGGKPSTTRVRPLARRDGLLLVEAEPRTGRTHQIRAHLAHLGLPIVGDALYDAPPSTARRILLHAWRLHLQHPRTGDPLEIVARPPPAFRSRFADALPSDDPARPG